MEDNISRRDFLKGMAASALVGAAVLGTSGCGTARTDTAAPSDNGKTADLSSQVKETVETDILIVGCGAAGIFAAYEAGKAKTGSVLVISNSPDAVNTNGNMVSGTCAVESSYTKAIGQTYTSQQLFEKMYAFSHYSVNTNLLHTCVDYMPENIQIFKDLGVEFTLGGDRAGVGFINVHLFGTKDKDAIIQSYLEKNYGVKFRFSLEACEPVMNGSAVAGIYAKDKDGKVIEIKAKAVVLACGGYLFDDKKMKEDFGVNVVPFSMPYQKGIGIQIAEKAGAFRESIVGLGMTDIVGATEKVGFTFDNPLLMMAFYGNLLVDQNGKRFTNEYELANESMSVGGESLLHVKKYYALYSQKTIDDLKTMGYFAHIGKPSCWPTGAMLYTKPIDNLDKLIEEGIQKGWIFKGDDISALAKAQGLSDLEDTVKDYDKMVASGTDTLFGKPIEMAEAVEVGGPYYLMQFNAGAFNTFGGCRTDEKTRALTADFEVIPGLYIAGVENGSLYSRPYYNVGGTCSGLAYSSGRLAGQQAAAYIKEL